MTENKQNNKLLIPYISFDTFNKGMSNTEMVELLIDSLNDLEGAPLNMMTVVELDRILRTLNQYVTLVGIDNQNRLGVVDIDTTVNLLKTDVKRLYNR